MEIFTVIVFYENGFCVHCDHFFFWGLAAAYGVGSVFFFFFAARKAAAGL